MPDPEGLEELRERAKSGDAGAQFEMGGRLEGTDAMLWYRKSAKRGDWYYHGKGVMQDYKLALEWYQKAAQAGSDEAASLLQDLETG
jgi:TPR repeat protein